MSTKTYHFDRNKPFYPFIVNYIYTLHGIIELASRSLIAKIENLNDQDKNKIFEDEKIKLEIRDKLKNNRCITPLIVDLSLRNSCHQDNIEINIEEIADDFVDNFNYLLPFQIGAASSLLVMSYESTKKNYDDKKSPIWNFLYQCRNAAGHNWKMDKINKDRLPAKWRHHEITEPKNINLFKLNDKDSGLLDIGDPIILLWDIEQQNPQMKAELFK